MQHRDQVVDVVVEIECPFRQRHHARINPVGDVDVVIGHKSLDSAAQQRRVVAGHRRDDQKFRLRTFGRMFELTLEIDEIAKRTLPNGGNSHRNSLAAREGRIDAPVRPAVTARRALEQFARGRDRFAECRIGKRIAGIFKKQPGCIRPGPRRVQGGMAHLIEPVEWSRDENTGVAWHRRRAAKLANSHLETVPSLPQCSIVTSVCHLVNLKANFPLFIWHVESTLSPIRRLHIGYSSRTGI